ncbi:MAG TPA: hypothetical protein VKN76_02685, partial [Kiloniellaceae bacterium]|nr:hypothetical protein [Kiloniellaceae bacterium]
MFLCLVVTACESNRDRQARLQAEQSSAEAAAADSQETPAVPPGVPPAYDPDLAQISLFSGMRVGLLVPLSGPYKDVGEALLNAAQL